MENNYIKGRWFDLGGWVACECRGWLVIIKRRGIQKKEILHGNKYEVWCVRVKERLRRRGGAKKEWGGGASKVVVLQSSRTRCLVCCCTDGCCLNRNGVVSGRCRVKRTVKETWE